MRACLFDIDGTLLASGGAGRMAMDAALRSEFGIDEPIDIVTMTGRTDRTIARDQFRTHGIEDTPENWSRLAAAYVQHLPRCLAECTGGVLPGVSMLLEHLGARDDMAVGLLTGNMREGARLKLTHFELIEYFAFGAYGDAHYSRDEVAAHALHLCHQHAGVKVRPEHVCVIGDTPLDVQCARSIGARVVAVATGVNPLDELAAAEPDLLLESLADTAAVLEVVG